MIEMKRSKRKIIKGLAAIGGSVLLLVISAKVIGQDPHRRGPGRDAVDPEMRNEIRAYVEENIIPVLREHRSELEDELSPEEKEVIAEIRSKRPPKSQFGPPPPSDFEDDDKEEYRQHRSERRKYRKQLVEIVDNHEDFFEQLRQILEPSRDSWQSDISSIVEEHASTELFHKPLRHHGLARRLGPEFFLLLEPDEAEALLLEVYPNPSNLINTVSYTIEGGNVTIKLLDSQGKVVGTLLDDEKEAGTHSLEVNLGNLERGTYYYQLVTSSGVTTTRILKD